MDSKFTKVISTVVVAILTLLLLLLHNYFASEQNKRDLANAITPVKTHIDSIDGDLINEFIPVLARPAPRQPLPDPHADAPWNDRLGPNTTDYILLTFDDCPILDATENFIQVMDWAKNNNISIMLFPTGNCVSALRNRGFDLVNEARSRGQWVGNHTRTHVRLPNVSAERMLQEVSGEPHSNMIRPPWGASSYVLRQVLANNNQYMVRWTLDTEDWRTGNTHENMMSAILDHAKPGDNVLMHMQHSMFNVETLQRIKDGLAERDLYLCPMVYEITTENIPRNVCWNPFP